MKKEGSARCRCPFCEGELKFSCFEPPFCRACRITLVACKKCGKMFNSALKKCPECGGVLEK